MKKELKDLCISPDKTLFEVMAVINASARGISLVVDEEGRLIDTVTDGDLRREILAGRSLERPFAQLRPGHKPVTLPANTPNEEILCLMQAQRIRHLPLVDVEGRLCDLFHLDDLVFRKTPERKLAAVIMAGGKGTRLHPLTASTPKPLLSVGEKPVVQRTIEQLRSAGVQQVYLATHYKPERFTEHFGNGDRFGVRIDYLYEENPLGTAGALASLPHSDEPVLVVNGDILTGVNYGAMLSFHEENQADMTVGVRQFEFSVPYGVVHNDGATICGIAEKPTHCFLVNAGIYLLQPDVLSYVPRHESFDMTDLIAALVADVKRVIAFPISEYWLDIGQKADYEKAQLDVRKGVV
jgi:dTDP-glucose pyrophosphorylase